MTSEYRGTMTAWAALETGLHAHEVERKARAQVAREGITVPNRDGNPVVNPAVKVGRDARRDFVATLKMLGIKL